MGPHLPGMDLRSQAEGAVAALGTGRVDQYLARNMQGNVPGRGQYEILEALPRRNLVFVSWRGKSGVWEGRTGTWVLSFDRAGRIISWSDAA